MLHAGRSELRLIVIVNGRRFGGSLEPRAPTDSQYVCPVCTGESYGRWRLDPGNMRASTRLAIDHGVAIGAHVGFPDLLGFGRRRIEVTADEVRDYAAYQIGALQAIVASEGGRLAHVKPHGALYALCSASGEHAGAIAAAIAGVDASLPLLLLSRRLAPAVEAHGVQLAAEAFPDLEYEPGGALVIEPVKQAWDPDRVARRAVRVVLERRIDTTDGDDLEVDAPTLCLHGDAPNAVETARTVRQALASAGVTVTALRISRT